jgi:hypothetical protein
MVKWRLQPETLFAPTRVLPTRGLLPDFPYLEVQYPWPKWLANRKGFVVADRGDSFPRCRIFW